MFWAICSFRHSGKILTEDNEQGASLVETALLVTSLSILSLSSLIFLGVSVEGSLNTASNSITPEPTTIIDYNQGSGGNSGGSYNLNGGGTSSGADLPCDMGQTPGFSMDESHCFPDGDTQAIQ